MLTYVASVDLSFDDYNSWTTSEVVYAGSSLNKALKALKEFKPRDTESHFSERFNELHVWNKGVPIKRLIVTDDFKIKESIK